VCGIGGGVRRRSHGRRVDIVGYTFDDGSFGHDPRFEHLDCSDHDECSDHNIHGDGDLAAIHEGPRHDRCTGGRSPAGLGDWG